MSPATPDGVGRETPTCVGCGAPAPERFDADGEPLCGVHYAHLIDVCEDTWRAAAGRATPILGPEFPTGLTPREIAARVPFRGLHADHDVRDQLRNVGRAMWSAAEKGRHYQAGHDTAYLLMQAADALDALAAAAAPPTAAPGGEVQHD